MKAAAIAELVGGELRGEGDREIVRVAALETARPDELAFAEGERALAQSRESRAGAIFVPRGTSVPGKTTIGVPQPKYAFARAAAVLHPTKPATPGVHSTAMVSADSRVDASACVGPYVVIERGASVGPRTQLGAGVYIGEGVQVGEDCVLHPRVTLYAGARVGDRVILHAGAVVGSDGFGYVFAEGRHHKFPQLGGAVIEDDVEIGANTTVDRGSLGTTVIGAGTKIDNLVQVAHNVRIGRHSVIAAQTGISGSVEVGDYVVMGGQVGIGDHARVLARAVLGGGAGVLPGKIVREGETIWGRPGRPLAEFKRMYAHLAHLPHLAETVKEISRRLRK